MDAKPLKVLLIEADERIAELTARYLRSQAIEVDIENGLTDRVVEQSEVYACIVLGPLHAVRDRRDFDRRLAGRKPPIVVFSAEETLLDYGVIEVSRPCSLRELLRRIRVATT